LIKNSAAAPHLCGRGSEELRDGAHGGLGQGGGLPRRAVRWLAERVVCHDADALRAAEVDQRLLAEVRVALDLRRAVAHAFSYGPVCRLTLVTCDWPAQAVAL